MKPYFKVRLLPNSKTSSKVMRKVNEQRDDELTCAIQWCWENNCRGSAAIKSGLFQLIKDPRTINKYLDGEIKIGHTKEYCSILNVDEEDQIVRYVKNKNRYMQGINKRELSAIIFKTLRLQKQFYKRAGYRKALKLSCNAENALEENKLTLLLGQACQTQRFNFEKTRKCFNKSCL